MIRLHHPLFNTRCDHARASWRFTAVGSRAGAARDACALSRLTSSRFRVGDKVRAAGVAFFDFTHGQTGHANNYLELHPPCEGAAVLEAVAPSFRPTGV